MRFNHDQHRPTQPGEAGVNLGQVGTNLGRRGGLPVWLATVGGVGFIPVAPGTAGSAVACLIFLATHGLGPVVHVVLIAGVTGLGIWASGASEAAFGRADDGRIVIDEVAGQWIALSPQFVLSASLPVVIVTAFVAFRVFDIWKPGPVRWAEQRFDGGLGVMADDVVAGVLAACVSASAVWLWGVT